MDRTGQDRTEQDRTGLDRTGQIVVMRTGQGSGKKSWFLVMSDSILTIARGTRA